MGNYAQLYVHDGPEQAEARLCCVYAEILHVPPGGYHVGSLDLVREDLGLLEDFLHAVLLGE